MYNQSKSKSTFKSQMMIEGYPKLDLTLRSSIRPRINKVEITSFTYLELMRLSKIQMKVSLLPVNLVFYRISKRNDKIAKK